jgi:hypothetical protein
MHEVNDVRTEEDDMKQTIRAIGGAGVFAVDASSRPSGTH